MQSCCQLVNAHLPLSPFNIYARYNVFNNYIAVLLSDSVDTFNSDLLLYCGTRVIFVLLM